MHFKGKKIGTTKCIKQLPLQKQTFEEVYLRVTEDNSNNEFFEVKKGSRHTNSKSAL